MADQTDQTTHLDLPFIMPSQAMKHVTHNAALQRLDAIVQLSVLSQSLAAPPAAPAEGDRYIIAAGASGAWAGHSGEVALWQNGAWDFATPRKGWRAWLEPEARLLAFNGSAWQNAGGASINPAALVGINTTADATNKLALKSDAALFAADDVTPGTGDMRLAISKHAAGKDAGLLLQDNYSTRAMLGLLGNDDLTLKVSPDGTSFTTSLIVDRTSGGVKLPAGLLHAPTGQPLAQLLPCPTTPEIWRSDDTTRLATPRSYTIASVSGAQITLTTAGVGQIFTASMQNKSLVRIWNMSKTPAQPAWVNWNNSTTQLNVSNAADIAGWTAGNIIQLGDPNPTGTNTLGMVAIDISNFLYNTFGAVFPQKGVMCSLYAAGVGGAASIGLSGDGAVGTVIGISSMTNGGANTGFPTVFTITPSPVSNSNLLFVNEQPTTATALATCFVRLLGVMV